MKCFILLSLVAFCSSTPLPFVGQGDVYTGYYPMSFMGQTMYPKQMLGQHIVNAHIQAARVDPVAIKEEIIDELPISRIGSEDVVERVAVKKPVVPLTTTGLFGRQGVKVGSTILKTPTLGETYTLGSMGYPVPLALKEEILHETPVEFMGQGQIVDRLVMEKPVMPTEQHDVYGVSGIKVGSTVLKTPSMDYLHQVPLMAQQKMMMQYPYNMMMQHPYNMMMQHPYNMMLQYPYNMMMQYPSKMMNYPMSMQGYTGQLDYPHMYQQYPHLLGQQQFDL